MEDFLYNLYINFVDPNLLADLADERMLLLTPLFFGMLAVALIVGFLFYIWPNRNDMSKLPSWLLALLLCGVLGLIINFVTCTQVENRHILRVPEDRTQGFLADQGGGIFFGYSVWMMLVTMVLFFLVSLILKIFSRNSNRVPFPYSRR